MIGLMKRSITAVLFDADGTLYDSNKLHYLAYKAAAKQLYGHSLNWKSFYENTVVGSKKGIDVLRERNGGIDTDAFYQLKDELYRDLVSSKLQPVPGVADFLQWCRSHHIKCYVVSNSRLISLELSLSALNLEGFFESIISVEDSGDLQKPHQFPYQLAAGSASISESGYRGRGF
jgi:beta-phosphoglucomutase-like phosphatase (HAD superfamily)